MLKRLRLNIVGFGARRCGRLACCCRGVGSADGVRVGQERLGLIGVQLPRRRLNDADACQSLFHALQSVAFVPFGVMAFDNLADVTCARSPRLRSAFTTIGREIWQVTRWYVRALSESGRRDKGDCGNDGRSGSATRTHRSAVVAEKRTTHKTPNNSVSKSHPAINIGEASLRLVRRLEKVPGLAAK